MPVSGNIVYHLCCHNGISDGGMCLPGPAQPCLTDRAGKRYGTVAIGGAVITRSEPHGAVHRQRVQPAGSVVIRCRCLLQNTRIKLSIENNQRAPASSPVVSVSRKTGSSANQVCASMANLPRSLFIWACRPRRVLASRCFSV